MTHVRERAFALVLFLFKLGLIACFFLGTLLVIGQMAGVLLQRPAWVSGASETFFMPTVAAAATFGVLGFIGSYLSPAKADDRSEEEV
ncbi:hypothetical protein [Nocardiopsis alborubida]|uniref:Uncharacterized protein n=1 Tax=Nocardiopsis alborubida TaxID=146802 RepID=A0A7X6RTJ9_9ACTN|nr:hypothetical protein [Nocardiopsis alborubida]NKZ01468.1 hypothetical protein [Nocardiopsis alborubida]